jgi:hypothetical protein
VKQANEILDTNMKELLKAIGDEQPVCPDDDAEPARPTRTLMQVDECHRGPKDVTRRET